ncbi:unnamed protein product [Effrenium voratum]|uniref:Uncharacterized protein n=1 Tax=Effrenium voratum TaxID=2562239 RepID=A0AA36JF94_9DINO|nr:unnamed protein product [Effrenium voratum]CAJ1456200.1 unnamed protein product [Effrenium voratum]
MAAKVQARRWRLAALLAAVVAATAPLGYAVAGRPSSKARSPTATAAMPEATLDWVSCLFQDGRPKQRVALQEAARLLMTIGPIVSMAGDYDGLSSIADAIDVLDAQELIREGQAAAASLQLDDDLIQLQLALEDGSEKVIDLFKQG